MANMNPAVVQLILELARDFPDANCSEIARAVDAALLMPHDPDLVDSPIEVFRAAAMPLLESIVDEG